MKLSKDTNSVIEYLDKYSNGNLRKKNDLAIILEIGASFGKSEWINELIFQGKIIYNLYSKIKKISSIDDGLQLLEKELKKSVIEIEKILIKITDLSDEEVIDRFDKIYLAGTDGSLRNIIDLSYDLSILKNLQSEMK